MFRADSYLKLNGSIKETLRWIERPMNHPEGRCLQLNLTKAKYSETTLILKFRNSSHDGQLQLTITGSIIQIIEFKFPKFNQQMS